MNGLLGLVLPLDDVDWMHQALCGDRDPEMWFPTSSRGRYAPRAADVAAEAKAVCAQCPVRSECLMYAFETDQRHGVWGGLDQHERLQLQARPTRRS